MDIRNVFFQKASNYNIHIFGTKINKVNQIWTCIKY